jgi:glutathione reductase (NADPH)
MGRPYDLAIIGSGTAAQVAASRVRDAGWSVAVIDHRPFGGTCALRGCDPKKVLISGAEAIDATERMRGHGVTGGVAIDWSDLIAFKRTFTDPVPARQENSYAAQGIDAFHGRACFTGRNSLAVGEAEVTAHHVLIAAGAQPIPLRIPGEQYAITSDRFLELEHLPKRIVLVGGGYIAAEFSHIAARAGAQVTVLQRAARMLPAFDPDLVAWLMDRFAGLGIDVRTRATVDRIDKERECFVVHAREPEGPQSMEADLVIHAAGRAPDLDGLDLEAGGVATADGRLQLNEYLQSVSNAAVYAAGDAAADGPPLTPVSSHDAKVVAANLLQGNHQKPDYRGVPSVAFTIPPIAAVGLSEAAVRNQNLRFHVNVERVPSWYTARRLAESVYGFKVLIEEGSDLILGAHLTGPHVDELINIFGLAIRNGITAAQLRSTIFAYPTGASDIAHML